MRDPVDARGVGGDPAARFAAMLDDVLGRIAALGPRPASPRLAVAVSGGGDSFALLMLAHDLAGLRGWPAPLVITVDHRLRPEAAEEAAFVLALARDLGCPARCETWTEARGGLGLLTRARAARYRLLVAAARAEAADLLLTGHTVDDLAETLIDRARRGAGPDGLLGIPPLVLVDGLPVARPLLGVSRAALREVLRARGLTWVEDPSNADRASTRVRIRGELEGLGPRPRASVVQSLAAIADAAGAARRKRSQVAAALLARAALVSPFGAVRLDASLLAAAPPDLAARALAAAARAVYPAGPALALGPARAALDLSAGAATAFGGAVVRRRQGGFEILRERRADGAAPAPLAVRDGAVWDRRLRLSVPEDAPADLALVHGPDRRPDDPPGEAVLSWPVLNDVRGADLGRLTPRRSGPFGITALWQGAGGWTHLPETDWGYRDVLSLPGAIEAGEDFVV